MEIGGADGVNGSTNLSARIGILDYGLNVMLDVIEEGGTESGTLVLVVQCSIV
jgi:hypothetical protein